MSKTSIEAFVSGISVGELAQRAGISVDDLVSRAFASNSNATRPAARPKPSPSGKSPKSAPAGSTKEVNTRTPEGRAAYQKAVLETLRAAKGEKIGAKDIRAAIGGTGLQARAALNVLIESKKARFEGKARATRYWAK